MSPPFWLYWPAAAVGGTVVASGGTETDVGGYRYHTFTSSGTFAVTTGGSVEVLLVAGGGGGGSAGSGGGGGGAGGVRLLDGVSALTVTAATYTITVGAGGAGGPIGPALPGSDGSGSSIVGGSINEASIGGGGGGGGSSTNGRTGGSGGGAFRAGNAGLGTSGQGNNGGLGDNTTGGRSGGGGGGAGAVGASGTSGVAGNGGDGTTIWGTTYGGGGGGATEGSTQGVGGSGGGGSGGTLGASPTSGTANSGGGGGAGLGTDGASGGSGIVIVRYPLSAAVLWTPISLGSLYAWYDADDASTITESSGLISAWGDKSGGGYHLTSSGAAQPTYTSSGLGGKSVVTFNATHWMAASTASDWKFLHDTTGSTIVVVWKAGNSSDPNEGYVPLTTGTVTQSVGMMFLFDDRASLGRNEQLFHAVNRGVSGDYAVNNISPNGAMQANVPTVLCITSEPANASAPQRSAINVDGGVAIRNNLSLSPPALSSPFIPLRLGSGVDGNGNSLLAMTGYFAEVVICNAILSDADRERVEGYLAHKWGLEGNLPVGHPYKAAPPYIT